MFGSGGKGHSEICIPVNMQDCPQNKLVLACATSNPVRNTENDPLAAKSNGSPGGVARGLRFSHLEIPEPFAKHQSCPKGP